MNFSFPTRKLAGSIRRITNRVKDFPSEDVVLTVYGVNNETGVSLTGKDASNDLSNYKCVSGNQFVYNPYRVNIGSIGLTPKNFKGVVSPAYVVFETKNDLDSQYLLFYLKSATGNNLIRWYGNRGGVRSALRYSDLCKLDIPDLTIEEQEKALVRFKAAQKDIKKLSRELEAQNGNIAKLRQAILQLAVQGKLSTSADSMRNEPRDSKVGDYVKFLNGYAFKSSWFQDCGIRLVRNKNVAHRTLDWKDTARISKDREREFQKWALAEGDIVISLDRPLISTGLKVAIIRPQDLPCLLLQRVAKAEFISDDLSPAFFLLWLQSPLFTAAINPGRSKGVPHISTKQIEALSFFPPPIHGQNHICKKVDELTALCDQLEGKIKQAKVDSDKLMASVIHHLLSRSPRRVRATTPYKNDAAVVCLLLSEMEKLQRPTTEFFIQKHIFVTKHHLHLPVNSLFVRKTAGPWSHELKQKVIFAAVKMNWLRWDKNHLVAGSAFEKALNHAATVLGESAAKITKLVDDLKAFGNNGLERWTTVLKVVEDLKEQGQPITQNNIQREIDNWPEKRLKEIFAEKSVDHTIAMMLKHKWLPPSAGQ